MKIRFNVTRQKRKQFLQAIAKVFSKELRYLKIPIFAYNVGLIIVDRERAMEVHKVDEG